MPGDPASESDGAREPVTRAVTMADVARTLGLSHQTVSRVLNDHPSVRSDTRARVLQAVEALGYRPNPAARALVTRRSQTLGVLSFDTTLYGPASTLAGVERAAQRAGYFVSVAIAEAVTIDTVRDAIERLVAQRVEGIIVIAPLLGTVQALPALTRSVPVVIVASADAPGLTTVRMDQVEGARMVTRHLLDEGASTVWHVAGPADWIEAEARVAGWRTELSRAGAAVPALLRGSWQPQSGYDAGRRLARRAGVEAVFVANDQMALGLLRAFHEAGVRVPGDILVAGFDDVPEAAFYTPPLTTVRQDFPAVGRRSIALLLEQVAHGGSGPRQAVLPLELIVRQSSQLRNRGARKRPRDPVLTGPDVSANNPRNSDR
jgi:DNA-binding LacI/PurR family transcriptional regulator